MMMNTRLNIMKVLIILLIAVVDVVAVSAQKRRVEEVKQDMNSLSLSIDNYTNALNKIKPALADAESKDEAETWFVAGKIAYGKYDKYRVLKSIGKGVDEKAMGDALLLG